MPNLLEVVAERFPFLDDLNLSDPDGHLSIPEETAAEIRAVLAFLPEETIGRLTEATKRLLLAVTKAGKRWVNEIGQDDINTLLAMFNSYRAAKAAAEAN